MLEQSEMEILILLIAGTSLEKLHELLEIVLDRQIPHWFQDTFLCTILETAAGSESDDSQLIGTTELLKIVC